jgi:hypothetical protein
MYIFNDIIVFTQYSISFLLFDKLRNMKIIITGPIAFSFTYDERFSIKLFVFVLKSTFFLFLNAIEYFFALNNEFQLKSSPSVLHDDGNYFKN